MINPVEHLPMVHEITKKFYGKLSYRYDYDDLFQAGCVGLMKAVRNFDASKGYKFSTYAYTTIWGNIHKFARDDNWYVAKRNKDRLKESYAPISLNKLVGEQKDTPILEFIADDISEHNNLDLQMALNKLPEILMETIKLRYFYDFTWKEISQAMGVSQNALYKRKNKALEILRKELTA